VKGIWRYNNSQIGMRKSLDMNYFMYYIQDLGEDMKESGYTDDELIQQLGELLQVIQAYQ